MFIFFQGAEFTWLFPGNSIEGQLLFLSTFNLMHKHLTKLLKGYGPANEDLSVCSEAAMRT